VSFRTKYVVALVIPPLIVFLPLGFAFLMATVNRPGRSWTVLAGVTVGAYLLGALLFATVVGTRAQSLDDAIEKKRDVADAASKLLNTTIFTASAYWCGFGMILAIVGTILWEPSVLGLQYFGEAAMVVASPAMAWTYWRSKRLLVVHASSSPDFAYVGSTWSITVKIALVFGGFFIVSIGALVLLITARVTPLLGEDVALRITNLSMALSIVACAGLAVGTSFLARDIILPMRTLKLMAARMAEGNFEPAAQIFSDDEIGEVARSFAITSAQLRSLIRHLGQSGKTITEGVRLMTSGNELLLDGAHRQSEVAAQSDTALGSIRDGARSVLDAGVKVADLTMNSAGRAVELKSSSVEVARRMEELFQSVEKSSSSTLEIDASSREMSRRTEDLSSISSDVLAFVSQMDATVAEIHKTATATANLSRVASESAAVGRSAVDETLQSIDLTRQSSDRTTDAFDALQKSLGKIDGILDFIGDLTNQTNLLSLNAAIIAAQAGEQDSGFSVIAEEIRGLADRTRTATKEIAGIIRNLRPVAGEAMKAIHDGVEQVSHTVELAKNASSALDEILASSNRSLEMSSSISRALQDQSSASHHLHSLAAKLSDTAIQNHRATEGQAEATRLLAIEAERVRDIALHVKGSSREQVASAQGIAEAMEQIAIDIGMVREYLEHQLVQAEQVGAASEVSVAIATENSEIADRFSSALQELVRSGRAFDEEVGRFRV
jgi:methyl-accepting chemotaxis protein